MNPHPIIRATLDAGEPVAVTADVADAVLAEPVGPDYRCEPFDGGPLHGRYLLVPAGQEPPAHWTVTDAHDDGSTTRSTYVWGFSAMLGRSCYAVDPIRVNTDPPLPGAGSGRLLDMDRMIADTNSAIAWHESSRKHNPGHDPQLPPPAPAFTWEPCEACAGLGRVVVVNLTADLRTAGHPFTVTAPCPSCAGAGGLVRRQT